MRHMSKLAAVALALLGTMVGAAHAEQVKVGVAAEPFPPFASPDAKGQWVGWEIDIISAVCTQAKLDCQITPVSFDGIIPALTTGKIDVIMASMSITDERKKVIDFSEKYYQAPAAIAGAKGVNLKPTPEGLAGKIVAAQASTTHAAYAKKHFTQSEIKEYQTGDEELQDLAAGRVDAVLSEEMTLEEYIKSPQGSACCQVDGRVASDVDIYGPGIGAGVRKGDALRDKINAAIDAIRSNDTYKKITARYFASDIYGD